MIIKVAHADPSLGSEVAFDVLDADEKVIRTLVIRPHQFELIESGGLILREVPIAVVRERERQAQVEADAIQKQASDDAKAQAKTDAKLVREDVAKEREQQGAKPIVKEPGPFVPSDEHAPFPMEPTPTPGPQHEPTRLSP